MTFKRLLGTMGVLCAIAVLTGSVGAGAARTPTKHAIDLSTNAAVKQYLRSLGISPRGVVIQRGARNYAGPNCPGKGWNCTRSQKVVQIATPARARPSAGTRSFFAKPPPPPPPVNVAKCSRTTGSSQSCSVTQSAPPGASNSAQVDETITQSGQTLNGSQDAQVTQTSASGSNKVQLNLKITQSATEGGTSVNQDLTSSQNFNISQTSTSGGAQSIQVEESSTQTETANSADSGTQDASGDLFGDISQSSSGISTAKIRQVHNVTQNALGPNVDQTVVDPFKCCATQGTNPANTFGLIQNGSVQTTGDTTPNISAVYEADCQSSGNCTVTESQNTNGATSTNTSSGGTVNTGFSCTGSTCTEGSIAFDGSPGTAAPPATLGPYTMTQFGPDGRTLGESVSDVSDPAGTIGFTPSLTHARVTQGWATWSHGYTGDVYSTGGTTITITLPAGTKAFYFYAEPQQFAVFSVEATAQDGTTSGPIPVQGNSGAQYFGFYGNGSATLSSITVTTADPTGFAVGEFGINPAAAVIL
jgi:hypothetical protein